MLSINLNLIITLYIKLWLFFLLAVYEIDLVKSKSDLFFYCYIKFIYTCMIFFFIVNIFSLVMYFK